MKIYYEMKYNYRNLFKDAHDLTKKTILKYKNINYKAQFIISIRFIIKEIKEVSEKILGRYNETRMKRRQIVREINKLEHYGWTEATNNSLASYKKRVEELRKFEKKEDLKNIEEFNFFINNFIGA